MVEHRFQLLPALALVQSGLDLTFVSSSGNRQEAAMGMLIRFLGLAIDAALLFFVFGVMWQVVR